MDTPSVPPKKRGRSKEKQAEYEETRRAKLAADPEYAERRRAARRKKYTEDPEYREQHNERRRVANLSPEQRAELNARAREHYRSNRAEIRQQVKDRLDNNPELKARALAQSNEIRRRNRDQYNAKKRETYHLRDKERVSLTNKSPQGRVRNRLYAQLKRARKRGLLNDFTLEDWNYALSYFGHRCAVCGRPEDFWTILAQDHWIPVKSGGGTTKGNIVPLCHARKDVPLGKPCCNNAKRERDPVAWLTDNFGERKAKEIRDRIQAFFDSLT